MLSRLHPYGPDARDCAEAGGLALGRCLYRRLDEDRFDRQPLTSEDGRIRLVADLRIDNRAELLADLGFPGSGTETSDSELLLRAWSAWGEATLLRMIGDFALAVWDESAQSLLLARDTAGERPLHYRQGDGFLAFASLAPPLAAVAGQRPEVDEARFARLLADLPPGGRNSYYKHVRVLEPGHRLIATRSGLRVEPYWEPSFGTLRLPNAEAYGDAMREALDEAVARRLRRAGGRVAAQLSSGFDSSAVATSAATLLAARNQKLLAFTSAPREGFSAPVVAGRIADESAIAAETAGLHENIEHWVLRPSGGSVLEMLRPSHELAGQPVGHVCNNLWWSAINRSASDAGASVMLTGEVGNFTLSAGLGVDTLTDLVAAGAWRRWWRESRALTAAGAFRWRNILNATLGPWVPERPYARLRGWSAEPPPFVAQGWRPEMRRQLAAGRGVVRPHRDSRRRRWSFLRLMDPGAFRKRSLAEFGIEERDPLNDRRFVQFCFSLPAEALLAGGVRRPALLHALGKRLPASVLHQRLRGYQMPDWYEQIPGEEVRAFADEMAGAGRADSLIDFGAVREAASQWPPPRPEDRETVARYRVHLLRTLSAAEFVNRVRSSADG